MNDGSAPGSGNNTSQQNKLNLTQISAIIGGISAIITFILLLLGFFASIYCAIRGDCLVIKQGFLDWPQIATYTPIPPPGPTPTIDPTARDNPETFIRLYYEAISSEDYEGAWDMTSDRFKCTFFTPCSDPPFEDYAAGFQNYSQIRVINAHIRDLTGQHAVVELQLVYTFKDGTETTNGPFEFTLVPEGATSWLIDDVNFVRSDD